MPNRLERLFTLGFALTYQRTKELRHEHNALFCAQPYGSASKHLCGLFPRLPRRSREAARKIRCADDPERVE
jgi:hypothetical protein